MECAHREFIDEANEHWHFFAALEPTGHYAMAIAADRDSRKTFRMSSSMFAPILPDAHKRRLEVRSQRIPPPAQSHSYSDRPREPLFRQHRLQPKAMREGFPSTRMIEVSTLL